MNIYHWIIINYDICNIYDIYIIYIAAEKFKKWIHTSGFDLVAFRNENDIKCVKSYNIEHCIINVAEQMDKAVSGLIIKELNNLKMKVKDFVQDGEEKIKI